jgi:hypothetical protein
MKKKTFFTNVDVDVDYQITFDDMLQLINSCNENELDQIRSLIGCSYKEFKADNIYDESKLKVLKVAYNKYNLDELQSKLNISNNDY